MFGVERPSVKFCGSAHNVKTIVLIENGKEDHLVADESKERFYEEMGEVELQWVFHGYAKTPHGFALPEAWAVPVIFVRIRLGAQRWAS